MALLISIRHIGHLPYRDSDAVKDRFAPCYITRFPDLLQKRTTSAFLHMPVCVHRVLAYPMRSLSASQGRFCFSIISCRPVLPVKSRFIAMSYPDSRFYDLFFIIFPLAARFLTFAAVLVFSSRAAPHMLQVKIPFFLLPVPPQ